MADQTANVVLSADVSQYNAEIDSAASKTQALITKVSSLVETVDKIGKGVRKGLFSFAAADTALLTGVTLAASKFEKELGVLKSTMALSQKSTESSSAVLKDYRAQIQKLSVEVPASRQEVTGLMTTMAKLGVTGAESATKAVKSILELGHATGESSSAIADSLIQLNTQMGTSIGTVSKFADQLAVLSVKSNSSAANIASFAASLAPIARNAGMTEKDLLAVSAAFNKVGADGFAAANAAATVMSDINNIIQTGSPDLVKYSNLIGVTADQFKKMDITEKIAKLFDAVNKGGPRAVSLLNQLGIDGIRAQRSIQAVASSGGIEMMLGASKGAGGAAEKGGQAATENLFDEMEKGKNRMQGFAVEVGKPLADVATSILKIFNIVANKVDEITKPFQGFLGIILAVSGAVAALVAGMLALTKVMAIPTLLAFLGQGTMVGAMRAGSGSTASNVQPYNTRMGAYQAQMSQPGMTPAQANANLAAQGMKPVSWYERGSYRFGEMARAAGFTGGDGSAMSTLSKGVGAAFQGWAAYNRWSAGFVNDAAKQGYDRGSVPGPNGSGPLAGYGFKDAFKNAWGAATDPNVKFSDGLKNAAQHLTTLNSSFGALGKSILNSTMLNSTAAKGAMALIGSFAQLGAASLRLAGSLMLAVGKFAMQQLGGSLLGMATNPMMLLMGGMMVKQSLDAQKELLNKPLEEASLSIKKYDDALGISTKKILSFSDAVDQAKGSTKEFQPSTVSEASTVRESDTVAAISRNYVSPTVQNLKLSEAPSWLRSLNITDPREMQAVKFDLIKRFGPQDAQRIIDSSVNSNTPGMIRPEDIANLSYVGMGRSTQQSGAAGWYKADSDWLGNISEQALDTYKVNTIGTARTFAAQQTQRYGLKAGKQAQYVGFLQALKGLDQINPDQRAKFLRTLEVEYFGGEQLGLSGTANYKQNLQTIGSEKIKERFGVEADGLGKALEKLISLRRTGDNLYESRIKGSSSSGIYASDRNFLAIGEADVGGMARAQQGLYENAVKLGAGFAGAYEDLQKMKISIGNVDDKLYKLAKSAQDYLVYQERRLEPFQTRQTNFNVASTRFVNAAEALKANPNDLTTNEEYKDAKLAYEQKQDEYQSYLQGIIRTYKNFNKQMQRSEEDHQRSMKRMVEEGAKTLYDPYERMGAQRIASVEYLIDNVTQQTNAIKNQRSQLDSLRKMGLSMKAIDLFGLADTGRAQQVEEIFQEIIADPALIQQLNQSVKKRIGASGGMIKSPYNKSFRESEEDRKRSITRSKKDLADAFIEITGSFNSMAQTALGMTSSILGKQGGKIRAEINAIKSDYKAAQSAIKQTSATNMEAISGQMAMDASRSAGAIGFKDTARGPVFTQQKGMENGLYSVAYTLAAMKRISSLDIKLARSYLADQAFITGDPVAGHAISIYANKKGEKLYGVFMGNGKVNYNGSVYSDKDFKTYHPDFSLKGYKYFAEGGIATKPTAGIFAEAGSPEAVIPLNNRGLGFMANFTGMVAREVMQLAYSSPIVRSGSSEISGNTSINRSTNFNGEITVIAQDPNEMARRLEAHARHRALTGSR